MVLSNKKLKEKLRSLGAESIASSESKKSGDGDGGGGGGVEEEVQRLKALISDKSRKKDLPKRRKRKRTPSSSEDPKHTDGIGDSQVGNSEGGGDDTSGGSKGSGGGGGGEKRNRGGDDAEEAEEGEVEEEKKKKSNKKLKKWWYEKIWKKKRKNKGEEEEEEKKEEGSGGGSDGGEKPNVPSQVEESVENAKKVYVGGIPYYSSEDDIRSFFESCGTVSEMDCMTFPESGKFRGIAILTFKTEAAAKRALAQDGADMGGFSLKIQPFKSAAHAQKEDFSPEIVEGYNRVYVGNLSWEITEDDLRKLLGDCSISAIRWGTDKETDDFKGYAHVDFEDCVSLSVALKLDQQVVCGRPVRIRCAVMKKPPGGASLNSGGQQAEASRSSKGPEKSSRSKSAGSKTRRTCYECGVPGHLSSSCPRKRAVEGDGSDAKSKGADSSKEPSVSADISKEPSVSANDGKTGKKKKKRQTCYECGVPGHLSSECPQKKYVVDIVDNSGCKNQL